MPGRGVGTGAAVVARRQLTRLGVRKLGLQPRWPTVVAALTVAAVLVALGVQAVSSWQVARFDGFLGAKAASAALAAQAAAALLVVLLAFALPASRRALAVPVALPGAWAAVMLALTAVAGGRLWDMVVTVLTLACAGGLGALVLGRLLGFPRLAGVVPLVVVIGLGVIGLWVFALGRLGILGLWLAGLPVAAGGVVVLARTVPSVPALLRGVLGDATSSRVRSAVAGLLLLELGWVAVYVAAPELQYDALYAKAWLPEHWAATGEIASLIEHPVLNNAGYAQFAAVPGHLLGGAAVGRYLQLVAVAIIVTRLWRLAPLAALGFAVTPQVFWQASTADDDAVLALAALALALVVLELVHTEVPFRAGLAVGLVAGGCVALKYHLAPLAAGIALAWAVQRAWRQAASRLAGVVAGALAAAIPSLAARWYDTGNPVFPQLNQIFHSPYYPPVDAKWDFPYWKDPGPLGPLEAVWKAMVEPTTMLQAAPKGMMGVLVLGLPVALLVGWRTRLRGGTALWVGLAVSLVAWWVEFRYLRYLLPAAVIALVLLVGVLPRPPAWAGRLAALPALAVVLLLAVLYFPATIASFWNVPQRAVPFRAAAGQIDARDYVWQSLPQVGALEVFNRLAESGAMVASDAHARTLLRDDLDLTPFWELDARLSWNGGIPATGDEALARYRALGVRWLLVDDTHRELAGGGYLPSLLTYHAEPVFGDGGSDLYRLVDRPSSGRSVAACDVTFAGHDACWSGTLDGAPGLTAAESSDGASMAVPTCPGQTLALDVDTAPGGEPTTVFVIFDDPDPFQGIDIARVPPGSVGRTLATAPDGTRSATVTIQPGPGGEVQSAKIRAFGPSCEAGGA